MGDLQSLNVERNSLPLIAMLESLFVDEATDIRIKHMRRAVSSVANNTLVMLAYNTRDFATARRFLSRAIVNDVKLVLNKRVVGMWIKSLFGPRVLDLLKRGRQRLAS